MLSEVLDKFKEDYKDLITVRREKKDRLYFYVEDSRLREVVEHIFHKLGCRLSTATALERPDGFEVIYHFSHDGSGVYLCPTVFIPNKDNPEMNSITPIVRGAEWIEREMMEMFGIKFREHPRPEKLLTLNHPEKVDKPLRVGGK